MMDPEWNDLQVAWRVEAEPARPDLVDVLRQRLVRHRRAARIYTVLDIIAAIAFCAAGVIAVCRSPTWPIMAWTAGVFIFSAAILAFAIWNRRDALAFSTQPTTDFLSLLRTRLERRARMPRFIAVIVVLEIGFGLVLYALSNPDWLVFAAASYAVVAVVLGGWWWWYRARLARERAQLDALIGDDLAPPPEEGSDGDR